jgi:hypothetical protein
MDDDTSDVDGLFREGGYHACQVALMALRSHGEPSTQG